MPGSDIAEVTNTSNRGLDTFLSVEVDFGHLHGSCFRKRKGQFSGRTSNRELDALGLLLYRLKVEEACSALAGGK